jgi:hypothetical protein
MAFIKLNEEDGSPVLVSSSKIIKAKPSKDNRTKLFLAHGDPLVIEVPFDEMEKILESCCEEEA